MTRVNLRVILDCPIASVWSKVTDLTDFSWRSDLSDLRIIDDCHFIAVTKTGIETAFTVTECQQSNRWAFAIENESIKGKWIGNFKAQGNHTILDFTEMIMPKKYLFRPFVIFYLKKQQRLYVHDLKKALNCEVISFVQRSMKV